MKKTTEFDFEALQKKIKVKNRKQGLLLVIMAVAASFGLLFGGRWLLDKFFYDPLAGNDAAMYHSYIFNRQLNNELTMPLYDMTNYQMSRTGIGTYRISELYDMEQLGGSETMTRSYELKRGQLTRVSSKSVSYDRSTSLFFWDDDMSEETLRNLAVNIKSLPDSTWMMVNVSFQEDMTLDEFDEWQTYQVPYGLPQWYAVRGPEKKENEPYEVLGFKAFGQSGAYPILKYGSEIWQKYPFLKDSMMNNSDNNISKNERLEKHFVSTLKYLQTQKDFVKLSAMVTNEIVGQDQLANMEKYVEKNGVKVYGATLWMSVRDLRHMLKENRNLKGVEVITKDIFPLSSQSTQFRDVEYDEPTP